MSLKMPLKNPLGDVHTLAKVISLEEELLNDTFGAVTIQELVSIYTVD